MTETETNLIVSAQEGFKRGEDLPLFVPEAFRPSRIAAPPIFCRAFLATASLLPAGTHGVSPFLEQRLQHIVQHLIV